MYHPGDMGTSTLGHPTGPMVVSVIRPWTHTLLTTGSVNLKHFSLVPVIFELQNID